MDDPRRLDRQRRAAMPGAGARIMHRRAARGVGDDEARALRARMAELQQHRRVGDAQRARRRARTQLAQLPLAGLDLRLHRELLLPGRRGVGETGTESEAEQDRPAYMPKLHQIPQCGLFAVRALRYKVARVDALCNLPYDSAPTLASTGNFRAQNAQSTVITPLSSAIAWRSSAGNLAST